MQPQFEPPRAIAPSSASPSPQWFEYPVRVQPHHTDFSGAVWHGSYVAWMEEARVECLRSRGVSFADLVAMGFNLPVVELSIRYHRTITMGMVIVVRTRMSGIDGVRVNWDYRLESADGQELHATAQVVLVAVDMEKGKIVRQLPPAVEAALAQLAKSI